MFIVSSLPFFSKIRALLLTLHNPTGAFRFDKISDCPSSTVPIRNICRYPRIAFMRFHVVCNGMNMSITLRCDARDVRDVGSELAEQSPGIGLHDVQPNAIQ